MRIAATYENGMIYKHFGHSENFKIYELDGKEIISSEIVPAIGSGHDALAAFLDSQAVDVLICGGIGDGAMNALIEAGIEVCAGAEGNTDDVLKAYLEGTLMSTGVNCDDNGEEGCGCGCGGDCGGCGEEGGCGGCGGGCGGCGGMQPIMEGPNAGKQVKVHYRGTLDDGTQFDSSYDRGTPLEFVCGVGMMIKGFDAAVINMKAGESVKIHIEPEDAYGPVNPDAIIKIPLEQIPEAKDLSVGEQVYLYNNYGQPFPVKVTEKDDVTITFDANHEMAGKALNFEIEVLEIGE